MLISGFRLCGVCLLLVVSIHCSFGQGHYENVALDKACNQSSRWVEHGNTCDKAINNNTEGRFINKDNNGPRNCIHTGRKGDPDLSPWWEVDLGVPYPIYTLTLWVRRDGVAGQKQDYKDRMSMVDILVDEDPCYTFGNVSKGGTRDLTVNCTGGVMFGSVVRVAKFNMSNATGDYAINLCEFQIFSCSAHYYGMYCDQRCGACLNDAPCDKQTGECDMCERGWKPTPLCDQECDGGNYGQNCTETCSPNCVDPSACDKVMGNCTCKSGWKPGLCEEGCEAGTYGQDCRETCGDGCSHTCAADNGHCTCRPGWQTPLCQQGCEAGTYGQDCRETCGDGCADNCSADNGHCTCNPGWQPQLCDEPCPDGKFGQDCSMTCSKNCDDVCDKATGNCTCKPGWKFPLCTEECDNGRYGRNCSQACGNCERGSSCHHVNGNCSLCEGNFQLPLCTGCKDGFYTQNCSESCSPNCDGVACDKDSGHCTCKAGWQSPNCTQECFNGSYGMDCGESCGHCRNISACAHDTGICETGCADGFTGDVCKEALQGGGPGVSSNTGTIAGAVVGVIVAVVLAVAVVVVVKRRQRQAVEKPGREVSWNTLSGSRSNDNVYQNVSTSDNNQSQPSSATHSHGNDARQQKPTAAVKPEPKSQHRNQGATNGGTAYASVGTSGQGGQLAVVPSPPPALDETMDDIEVVVDAANGDMAREKNDVYYCDDVYMTSEAARLKLDAVQQRLLDKLRNKELLDEEFAKLNMGLKRAHKAGAAEENKYKNRFKSILPYDDTRVVLRGDPDPGSNGYVNASYIRGPRSDKVYIAAQGAKKNTVGDFWKLVWQEGVTHIVMLTNTQEGEKKKCEQYWPSKGASQTYGSFDVTGLDVEKRADYVIREFIVKDKDGSSRHVTQYHYVTWLDHSVPSTTALVDFWRTVTTSHWRKQSQSPLFVHCSAGVGRTGTFIGLDIAMSGAENASKIDVFRIVERMREDRCNMIQAKSQYRFLYEAVLEAYTSRDTRVDVATFEGLFPDTVDPNTPQGRIDSEFGRLKQIRVLQKKPSHTEAEREENLDKNRNPSLLPDDNHLVYLTRHVRGRNQYINAVFMPTFVATHGCIATQLPLPHTMVDMWRMVAGNGVTTIVSLGSEVDGSEKTGCYWPRREGQEMTFGPFTVVFENMSDLGHHLKCYQLTVKDASDSNVVRLLHYSDWKGEVPGSAADLLQLAEGVVTEGDGNSTVVVQCIDGVSKSGLFCAICDVIRRITSVGDVDIYMAVRQAQIPRPETVASLVQYRFLYTAVQEYSRSFSLYQNA